MTTFRDPAILPRKSHREPVPSDLMWDPWAFAEEEHASIGFGHLPVKGVYVPAVDCIVLQRGLPTANERSVLAEELAHRALGHRPHPSQVEVDRMEQRASRWAAVRLVSLDALAEALRTSSNSFEVAEELNVDPELLEVRIRWLTDDEKQTIGLVDE